MQKPIVWIQTDSLRGGHPPVEHLVAMLGTAGNVAEFEVGENLEVSSKVQAVVDYFGPTDFSTDGRTPLSRRTRP